MRLKIKNCKQVKVENQFFERLAFCYFIAGTKEKTSYFKNIRAILQILRDQHSIEMKIVRMRSTYVAKNAGKKALTLVTNDSVIFGN